MKTDQINDLIEKLLANDMSEAEKVLLNDILKNDRWARDVYLERMRLETELQEHYAGSTSIFLNAQNTESRVVFHPWKKYLYPVTMAACVMLGFLLAQFFLGGDRGANRDGRSAQAQENILDQADEMDDGIGPIAGSGHFKNEEVPGDKDIKQIWLDELGALHFKEGWGDTLVNASVSNGELTVAGVKYQRGIGTHAESEAIYKLADGTLSFCALVGISDSVLGKEWKGQKAGCMFRVVGDGKDLWKSGLMRAGDRAKMVRVSLKGIKELRLIVDKGPDEITFDHANWMDASFSYLGAPPEPRPWVVNYSSFVLTPQSGPSPRINGAKVVGGRPDNPFLFRIPTTGERPMTFQAEGLPKGIELDPENGILSGKVPAKGDYQISLHAKNKHGQAKRTLKLVAGDTVSLTPPMGWNSWYCWSESISAKKVENIAQALVDTGLADHGWTYVNIDDCWQGRRGGPLNAIQGNSRFPDMKGLCDTVHSHGLKIGIYSTPWISSYAGFVGGSSPNPSGVSPELHIDPKDRHQMAQVYGRWPSVNKLKLDRVGKYWFCDQDAKQWAEWGIDYVKYDWHPNDIPTTARILDGLQNSGRDIVCSLSNNTPFKNAAGISRLANLWRTGGDIHDDWNSILRNGFHKAQWAPYSRPGHWNDPDVLQIGSFGRPNKYVKVLVPTRLNPHEQYSQMSLWCLMAAPLFLGCDVENMSEFTRSLLTNDEVIAINQDPLGKSARPVNGNKELWLKPLEDGSYALGIFNLGSLKRQISVEWKQLGLPDGNWMVRDLWRQQELGLHRTSFSTGVESHGVRLIRLIQKP